MKPLMMVLALVWMVSLTSCAPPAPILIGVAVELTGRQADVGVNVRDAAIMAVEEINARGGVNGRRLQLVVRDDQGLPEVARQVDAELVDMGVAAIIGHYTSGQTAAVLDQMNAAQVVLLSPTSSSTFFSGKDDYFFRLIPDVAFLGRSLATHMLEAHAPQRVVGVYDENNRVFAEPFWLAVEGVLREAGCETSVVVFNGAQSDLKKVAQQIEETQPDAVVFVASAVDTAVLAQYLRQLGVRANFFSSSWAQTNQLLEKGGRAVEGLEIGSFYNLNNREEAHQRFVNAFEARFGRKPELGAPQSYESVLVLAEALKMTGGRREGLREALLTIRDFPGVLGPITFDAYGDVQRTVYIMRVSDGEFVEKLAIPISSP